MRKWRAQSWRVREYACSPVLCKTSQSAQKGWLTLKCQNGAARHADWPRGAKASYARGVSRLRFANVPSVRTLLSYNILVALGRYTFTFYTHSVCAPHFSRCCAASLSAYLFSFISGIWRPVNAVAETFCGLFLHCEKKCLSWM